jgi:acetyltransferase-like isoleucine patch superfamily enzyme
MKMYSKLLRLFCLLKILVFKLKYRSRIKIPLNINISISSIIKVDRLSTIFIGNGVSTSKDVYISAVSGGKIEIGSGVFFNQRCLMVCRSGIFIENNCIFGPNVTIYDHDHEFNKESGISLHTYKESTVVIGEGTWVGANAIILKGTSIGKNCIIGAGAIVRGNIPDNSIVKLGNKLEIISMK